MSHRSGPDARTVGIMADPGLPEKVARSVVRGLEEDLRRGGDGRPGGWAVEVSRETLPLTGDGTIPLFDHAPRLLEEHGWDVVVYLTDLPRVHEDEPLLLEVGLEQRAALVCLPAMGADLFRRKMRRLTDVLVDAVAAADARRPTEAELRRALGRGTVRRTGPGDGDDVVRAVLPGALNRLRLLAGMVHSNRPGRLVRALSSCVAAATATGAFGIFYASIWNLSDGLSPLRLLGISAMVVAALSTWLIVHNGLWNRLHGSSRPWRAGLDNASTVLTVGLSVALMYLLLWAVLFVIALAVVDADYLAGQLGHGINLFDYGHLTWLAASLGTMAGALGSNFDDDEAIREATYSKREHQRRLLADD